MNKLPMAIAGAACGAVSIILGVVAIAVPKWLVRTVDLIEERYGLWRVCDTNANTGEEKCMPYDQARDWIIATSVFEVAGICVIFFAVLLAFLHLSVAKNSNVAGRAPGPCANTGGLIMIIGVIIWAVKYKDDALLATFNLSVGFILGILSAVLSIIAGILLHLVWRVESREHSYTAF